MTTWTKMMSGGVLVQPLTFSAGIRSVFNTLNSKLHGLWFMYTDI